MDGKRKEKKQRQQIYQREQSFTFKKKSENLLKKKVTMISLEKKTKI